MQSQSSSPRQLPSSHWPTIAIVITVVLALIAGLLGAVLVVRSSQINRLEDEVSSLESDLDSAEERISDLESQLAQAGTSEDGGLGGFGDLLGDLLGGGVEGTNPLDDLLGGLLGGEGGDLGDLDDLFGGLGGIGGGETNLAACLTGAPGSITISDDDLDSQIDDISDAVVELRELDFPAPIEPILVIPGRNGQSGPGPDR